MRHRRCRSIVSAPPHGFTLRASPAVKHRVSPLGTVDERAEILCLLPSPRIACSLADTLTHCIAYYRPHVSYIVLRILSTHCITYHSLRIPYMVLQILSLTAGLSHPPPHRAASGGGAPCVTAGDTRAKRGGTREKVDSTNFRRRRRRTESVEGGTWIGSSGCCATPPVSEYSFSPSPRVHPSGITRG